LFESTPTYPNPGLDLTYSFDFKCWRYIILFFPTGRYWETVQRLKINQLYAAPTAIRLLLKYGDEHVEKYDLSSLRTLGSVIWLLIECLIKHNHVSTVLSSQGEPINNVEAYWHWYNKNVRKQEEQQEKVMSIYLFINLDIIFPFSLLLETILYS
jgi:acetyl-CoA synthetase